MKFNRRIFNELGCGIIQIHGFDNHSSHAGDLERDIQELLADPKVTEEGVSRGLIIGNLAGYQILEYVPGLEDIGFKVLAKYWNPRTGNRNFLMGRILAK